MGRSAQSGVPIGRPGATASLREGLADTLTLTRLGITGSLRRTLESPNPMESMVDIIKDHCHRVRRWASGEMTLRWSAAGMLAAQAQFRRVQGYRELPVLAAALKRELKIETTEIATNRPVSSATAGGPHYTKFHDERDNLASREPRAAGCEPRAASRGLRGPGCERCGPQAVRR